MTRRSALLFAALTLGLSSLGPASLGLTGPAMAQSSEAASPGAVAQQFKTGANELGEGIGQGATRIGHGIRDGAILTWQAMKNGAQSVANTFNGHHDDDGQ